MHRFAGNLFHKLGEPVRGRTIGWWNFEENNHAAH